MITHHSISFYRVFNYLKWQILLIKTLMNNNHQILILLFVFFILRYFYEKYLANGFIRTSLFAYFLGLKCTFE